MHHEEPGEAVEAQGVGSTVANRTAALLQERQLLVQRLSLVDSQIESEMSRRRRELTERYERELRQLEEEAAALGGARGTEPGLDGLKRQIATAARMGAHHQDVAHQDIDIDVALTHIDSNGDGIITTAEVKDASAGALVWHTGTAVAPAVIGCLGGVLFYLALRSLRARALAPRRASDKQAGDRATAVLGNSVASRERRRRAA